VDEKPVVFFEDKMMYKLKGRCGRGVHDSPLGPWADVKREGKGHHDRGQTSSMVQVALGAADSSGKKIGFEARSD